MNPRICIPRNKHDLLAIEHAKGAGFPALNEVLPELLAWLEDANWPVALPTASVLAGAGSEIVPPIRDILKGNDSIWKFWVIDLLVRHLKPDVQSELRADLLHLANEPTADEKLEEVDCIAREVLAEMTP